MPKLRRSHGDSGIGNSLDPGYRVRLTTVREEKRLQKIRAALSPEKSKVTLPKFSWDKDK